MLRGVHPLLSGPLLHLLDDLGHGDVVGLVDRNFPAHRYGVPVVDLRGVDTASAAQALLSVLPLDGFVSQAVHRMEVDGHPEEVTPATQALVDAASAAEARPVEVTPVERFAFYEAAREAAFFVHTGETVPYSCYLLRKGVV